MSQSEDIDAIAVYMAAQSPKTPLATNLKNDWVAWLDQMSWYDKNFTSHVYDTARNKRNAFNIANATSAQELENVKNVIKTGINTEQLQGLPDRRDGNGNYPLPPPATTIVWPYFLLGTAVLASFGYALASAARLGGR